MAQLCIKVTLSVTGLSKWPLNTCHRCHWCVRSLFSDRTKKVPTAKHLQHDHQLMTLSLCVDAKSFISSVHLNRLLYFKCHKHIIYQSLISAMDCPVKHESKSLIVETVHDEWPKWWLITQEMSTSLVSLQKRNSISTLDIKHTGQTVITQRSTPPDTDRNWKTLLQGYQTLHTNTTLLEWLNGNSKNKNGNINMYWSNKEIKSAVTMLCWIINNFVDISKLIWSTFFFNFPLQETPPAHEACLSNNDITYMKTTHARFFWERQISVTPSSLPCVAGVKAYPSWHQFQDVQIHFPFALVSLLSVEAFLRVLASAVGLEPKETLTHKLKLSNHSLILN